MSNTSNIFICMSAYHLLQALNIGRENDVVVISMDDIDQKLNDALKDKFSSKVIFTPGLDKYKKHKITIPIIFRYNMAKVIRCVKNKRIGNIYVFNDVSPITQYLCHNISFEGEVIMVEEGIGLYRDSIVRQKMLFKLFGQISFGESFNFILRQGTSDSVQTILCHYPQLLDEQQLQKKIRLMPSANYGDLAKKMNISQVDGCDWFVGQPLVEDGVMSIDAYMNLISHLANVSSRLGRQLVIKPHPREILQKYKGIVPQLEIVSDWKVPMELLLGNTGNTLPTRVYTVYSSAILQLSTINNLQCYLLYNVLGIDMPELDRIFSDINAVKVNTLEELI